jgi:FixJ family two-component response regulator
MPNIGHVLIADDEETFLESTTAILQDEGYDCDSVHDAAAATEKLRNSEYDLLIADLKMPGNADLELVRSLPNIAAGMPVILVTGYPTLPSAIQSIRLPVYAYLVKPVEIDELLALVKAGVEYSRVHKAVQSTQKTLDNWGSSIKNIASSMDHSLHTDSSGSVDSFLKLTHDNIVRTFGDLLHVSRALATQSQVQVVCHLVDCPKLAQFYGAIVETVRTLEKTKTAFKSKELGDLRKKLESLIEQERRVEANSR